MRILLILLLAGMLVIPVQADRRMMPMMMRGQMMMGGSMMYPLCPMMGHSALDTYVSYRDELKLTDDQTSKLKAVRSAYKKEAAKRSAYFDALDKADGVLTAEQRKKVQKLSGGMVHRMDEKESPSDMEKMHNM